MVQIEWREIQKRNFTSLEKLADFLQIDNQALTKRSPFPLNLPQRLAEKMEKGRLSDPLLRQFVPLAEEEAPSDFPFDPVQDATFAREKKLLQKYEGRALLLVTSSCAMHCRFCFRQHYPYERNTKGYENEILQIEEDPSLEEIILSGGDPLSVSNEQLGTLIGALEKIPHVKRLRFHTRFPIGIPERIDDAFLRLVAQSRLQIWFVIHSNHPREWDDDVIFAMKRVQRLGIPVLCQTVLLKGVNDDINTLESLCKTLIDNGILPYYLHQLDRVRGAAHFEVEEAVGRNLVKQLSERLSGYGVFRYVREIAGEKSKTPLH